jgi:hypothetical protein
MNGDFATGMLAPWVTFGTITHQIVGGVFEFTRPNATPPAGVVLQSTGQSLDTSQILTATFQLGNSSAVRKRVTVLLHDAAFGDLAACTFWLPPGLSPAGHAMRTYASQPWTNTTISVYAATIGPDEWTRLDDVVLQHTPSMPAQGTECLEPAAMLSTVARPTALPGGAFARRRSGDEGTGGVDRWKPAGAYRGEPARSIDRVLTLPMPVGHLDPVESAGARLRFESLLTRGRGVVQVSAGDGVWTTVAVVANATDWIALDIDLGALDPRPAFVRFRLEASDDAVAGSEWTVRHVHVVTQRH